MHTYGVQSLTPLYGDHYGVAIIVAGSVVQRKGQRRSVASGIQLVLCICTERNYTIVLLTRYTGASALRENPFAALNEERVHWSTIGNCTVL